MSEKFSGKKGRDKTPEADWRRDNSAHPMGKGAPPHTYVVFTFESWRPEVWKLTSGTKGGQRWNFEESRWDGEDNGTFSISLGDAEESIQTTNISDVIDLLLIYGDVRGAESLKIYCRDGEDPNFTSNAFRLPVSKNTVGKIEMGKDTHQARVIPLSARRNRRGT